MPASSPDHKSFIKTSLKLNRKPSRIFQDLQTTFGEGAPNKTTTFLLIRQFKDEKPAVKI
jgi:hypothetical protein